MFTVTESMRELGLLDSYYFLVATGISNFLVHGRRIWVLLDFIWSFYRRKKPRLAVFLLVQSPHENITNVKCLTSVLALVPFFWACGRAIGFLTSWWGWGVGGSFLGERSSQAMCLYHPEVS